MSRDRVTVGGAAELAPAGAGRDRVSAGGRADLVGVARGQCRLSVGGVRLVEVAWDRYVLAVASAAAAVLSVGVQGPPGPPGLGGAAGYEVVVGAPVGGHRAVIRSAALGVVYADPADPSHCGRADLVGVALNAADAGGAVTVIGYGEVSEPSWAWDVARPVFLGAAGSLTQTPPAAPAQAWAVTLGYPTAPQTLMFDPGLPTRLS